MSSVLLIPIKNILLSVTVFLVSYLSAKAIDIFGAVVSSTALRLHPDSKLKRVHPLAPDTQDAQHLC